MSGRLRVGLMLDCLTVPAWQYRAVTSFLRPGLGEVKLIILKGERQNSSLKKLETAWKEKEGILYRLHLKIDGRFSVYDPDAFELKDLSVELAGAKVMSRDVTRKDLPEPLLPEQKKIISEMDLDVIISMDHVRPRGEILGLAKYGVWTCTEDDARQNPLGYGEILEGRGRIYTDLKVVGREPRDDRTIDGCWSPVDDLSLSIANTRNIGFWRASTYIARQMRRLLGGEGDGFPDKRSGKDPGDRADREEKADPVPGNLRAFRLGLTHLYRILSLRFRKRLKVDQWFLMYHTGKAAQASLVSFRRIVPPKDRFWADPFLVRNGEKYFIFFEELVYSKAMKGHISVIEMDKSGAFTEPGVALEREHHLSYPFVFPHLGAYYMIPETEQNKTIELYECTDFPWIWEKKMTLMENVRAVDASVFYHNDRWWLFAAMDESGASTCNDELFLFWADDLFTTEWHGHPMNPIVSDARRARPAGRIFVDEGRIIRPGQNCAGLYGRAVNLSEITTLNGKEYEEVPFSAISPEEAEGIEGVHTFSREDGLTVIDGFMRRNKLADLCNRLGPLSRHTKKELSI